MNGVSHPERGGRERRISSYANRMSERGRENPGDQVFGGKITDVRWPAVATVILSEAAGSGVSEGSQATEIA